MRAFERDADRQIMFLAAGVYLQQLVYLEATFNMSVYNVSPDTCAKNIFDLK